MFPRLQLIVALVLAGCSNTSSTGDAGGEASSDAPSADAIAGDAGHGMPAPGTATADNVPCDPGALAGATCTHLVVRCPGVADLGVAVRVAKPASAGATILVGSGGAGNGWLEDAPLALALEKEMLAGGYVVASRKWDDPGWFSGSSGLFASSCRYGTLLRWVDEHVRAIGKPYCALGLSGGSYEVGYALARWDGADRLAGALVLAGPAVSRLDWVCPSVAPASWTNTDCKVLATKYAVPCAGSLFCTLQGAATVVDSAWTPDHPCTDAGDPRAPSLAEDGVVSNASRYDYPTTRVRFVLGADECGAQALLYYDRIGSDRAIAYPAMTPHDVLSTNTGAAATKAAIQQACAPF